jgi:glutamyl-tRNA reductase
LIDLAVPRDLDPEIRQVDGLHPPTVRMKEAAVTAEGARFAWTVRHLFDLAEAKA